MATIQGDAGFGWGGALPVPSVQELVRNDAKSIPERYVRNLEQGSKTCDTHPVSGEIPILDFSKLVEGDRDEWTRLDVASREWGFFQVVNHGAEGVLPKLKAAMGQFVDLPYAEKKKYGMAPNDIQGYGQAYVVADDQKLDWSDLLALITLPAESRNMKYWPLTIPGFKETVEEHAAEMQRIGDEILMIFSLLMGLEGDFLKRRLGADMKQTLWMNYYPSCSRPDLVLGLSPHLWMNYYPSHARGRLGSGEAYSKRYSRKHWRCLGGVEQRKIQERRAPRSYYRETEDFCRNLLCSRRRRPAESHRIHGGRSSP